MNATELAVLVDRHLSHRANKSGTVLYSGLDTLTKGDFYVVGLNPGGSPSTTPTTIRSDPHEADYSAYTQDCWQKGCDGGGGCTHKEGGRVLAKFLGKHQKNALAMFEALGREPENVLSTNCVFARSEGAKTFFDQVGSSLASWEAKCWPVHQAFLDIVRPSWIISFGYGAATSAFGFWRMKLGCPDWTGIGEGRRGGWHYHATFDLGEGRMPLETEVLGVPHPSYFKIGDDLEAFIREHVA